MIKYKLVNESIAQETIKDLDSYLSEFKSSVDYKFDEEFRMDVGNLSQDIRYIEYYQDEPSYDFLNDFLSDDYLDIEELTFCLSGLNPKGLHEIRENLPNTFRNRHREPINLLKSFFEDRSSIYRKLYKASMSIDGFAYEENNELTINSEVFIPWAIEKYFIEKIDNNGSQNTNNTKYTTWQKNHNTVVVLTALDKRWEEDKSNGKTNTSVSQLLRHENTNFYKNIKDNLVSVYKDTDKLPEAKTLRNYISAHNNFKKSLNQD